MYPTSATPSRFSPQLDGLRGVAILMVFFHHSGLKITHWADWGQMGVRVFFVLTGYLITLSLWKIAAKTIASENTGHLKELGIFHLRRLARLLPAFYLALALGAAAGLADVVTPMVWHLGFATNFYIAAQGYWLGPTAHFWSLALQEQFYLLWPFVVLFVPKIWFPRVLLGVIAAAYLYRVGCFSLGVPEFYRWLMLPGSLDSFALGGLVAWMVSEKKLPKIPGGFAGANLLLLVIGAWFLNRWIRSTDCGPWVDSLPEVFEGICAVYLLVGCIQGWKGLFGKFLEWNPLRALGKISYGVFIYHLLLLFLFEPAFARIGLGPETQSIIWSAIMLSVTIVVSAASYRYLEAPVSRLAKRLLDKVFDDEIQIPVTSAEGKSKPPTFGEPA